MCRYQFSAKRELSAWMRNPKSGSVSLDAKAIMQCLPQGFLFDLLNRRMVATHTFFRSNCRRSVWIFSEINETFGT